MTASLPSSRPRGGARHGWSRMASPCFRNGASRSPFLKQGEAILDQPWRAPPRQRLDGNEAVNLELFELFQGLAQ